MTIRNKNNRTASPITREKLLADIDKFCDDKNISTSEFGRLVFNDSSFYGRVIKGRSPTLDRIVAIYEFMSENGKVRSGVNDLID